MSLPPKNTDPKWHESLRQQKMLLPSLPKQRWRQAPRHAMRSEKSASPSITPVVRAFCARICYVRSRISVGRSRCCTQCEITATYVAVLLRKKYACAVLASKIEPWNDLWRANIKRARACAYILLPVINTHTHTFVPNNF